MFHLEFSSAVLGRARIGLYCPNQNPELSKGYWSLWVEPPTEKRDGTAEEGLLRLFEALRLEGSRSFGFRV